MHVSVFVSIDPLKKKCVSNAQPVHSVVANNSFLFCFEFHITRLFIQGDRSSVKQIGHLAHKMDSCPSNGVVQ